MAWKDSFSCTLHTPLYKSLLMPPPTRQQVTICQDISIHRFTNLSLIHPPTRQQVDAHELHPGRQMRNPFSLFTHIFTILTTICSNCITRSVTPVCLQSHRLCRLTRVKDIPFSPVAQQLWFVFSSALFFAVYSWMHYSTCGLFK